MVETYKITSVKDLESGLKEIEQFVELPRARGILAIVGESPSGKTTLVKKYLESKDLTENEYYLDVNYFVISSLKKRKDYKALELDDRRGFIDKNKRIIEKLLSKQLYSHFKDNKILVLDSIELLFKYEVNLAALAYEPASGGRTCIICVSGCVSGEKIYFMGKLGIISYHHCDKVIQLERKG